MKIEQTVKDLPFKFKGRGQMKDCYFSQIKKSERAFLYQVKVCEEQYYHVFLRKINKRFGVVSYPSPEAFGRWAYQYRSLDKAMKKFNELNGENEK